MPFHQPPVSTGLPQLEAFLNLINNKDELAKSLKVYKDAWDEAREAINEANELVTVAEDAGKTITRREVTVTRREKECEKVFTSNRSIKDTLIKEKKDHEAEVKNWDQAKDEMNQSIASRLDNVKVLEQKSANHADKIRERLTELDNRETRVQDEEARIKSALGVK